MLFDLVDALQKRRRLIFVVLFVAVDAWLLSFCTQTLQTHRSTITARIKNTQESSQAPVSSSSDMLLDLSSITAGLGRAADVVEVSTLRVAIATADGITKAEHGLQTASKVTLEITTAAAFTTLRTTSRSVAIAREVTMLPPTAVRYGVGHTVGAISGATNTQLASVIKPKNDIAVPVITPEQAQQVQLIQSGTFNVEPITPIGAGGACDNGSGNGGYPMEWCDARMDSIRTVPYSSDRINRQCTSYAYWYFTTVEGHTDFHVTGNANRWTATSNYPVHKAPAVGAIAVETTGVYGHVAIVQALPGQVHDGKAVPPGYVLVSEMNYDWHGHFRYSYSPLTKFSAYIYP